MRRILVASAAAVTALLLASAVYLASGLPPRAEVRALATKNPGSTALMRQREEEARRRKRSVRHVQTWVPLSHVSRYLIHAVVASEDQKFFGHEGVDWTALQESLEKDVEKRRAARGGSTITQQLAKNLFFGTRKTLVRKLRELVVARWLETDLTKTRILTLYLNVIEWGDGIYGCEAAARYWYGKPAADLGPEEAAGLAAMIPNPRRINPRVSPARHERGTRRVLWLMGLAGYLGRDAATLGAEPPPEPETDAEESEEEPPPEPPPPGSAGEAASPSPKATPAPARPTAPVPDPGTGPVTPPSEAPPRQKPAGAILSVMNRPTLRVADYMTSDPMTVGPEDSLMQALETMRLRKVRRLPVAVGGVLVGLVTEGDLKRAEPSMLTDTEEDFNRVMEETPVSRIMIQNPVTVTAETSLLEAADTMHGTKYGALPVIAEGRLVGILTDNDLARALVDLLRAEAEGAQS
jgi:monofunctional biosynthetic peptidoglycan transglycosylase